MSTIFYIAQWIGISIALSLKRENYGKKLFVILMGILYVFFATCRDVTFYTNLDAFAYYNIFEKANTGLITYLKTSNVEFGFAIICWLIKNSFGNYHLVLLLGHSVIYCSFAYFIRKVSVDNSFCFVAIICLNLFSAYYIFRNIISVSFALIMFVKMIENKYGSAIVFLVLSLLFHNSAFILVLVYCVYYLLNRKEYLSKRQIVAMSAFIFIVSFLPLGLLRKIMQTSAKYNVYDAKGSFAFGMSVLILFIIIWSLVKYSYLKHYYGKFAPLLIILCCSIVIFPLESVYGIMYRMFLYFIPVAYSLLMYIVDACKKNDMYYEAVIISLLMLLYSMNDFVSNTVELIGVQYHFAF